MVVFNSAFEANADRVDTDRVLIVKGRVDQKEAGEVKLIVNEVEPFQPTPRRSPPPPRSPTSSRRSGG